MQETISPSSIKGASSKLYPPQRSSKLGVPSAHSAVYIIGNGTSPQRFFLHWSSALATWNHLKSEQDQELESRIMRTLQ